MGQMAVCVVIFDLISFSLSLSLSLSLSNQLLYLIYFKLRNCAEIKSDQVHVYLTLPY